MMNMSEPEKQAVNGDDKTNCNDNTKPLDGGKGEFINPKVEKDENSGKSDQQPIIQAQAELPVIIDDLAELGVEWLLTKSEESVGNWGKQYETSEILEYIEDGQQEVEKPPPMPDVKLSNHGQTMHLVPLKEDGRTSTTLTWIRKSALRKDSVSDRRITIRGISLGDLFHPRIYTLIQMGQSVDYVATDRSAANTCVSGMLTINFRTILDRITALRRYLLDITIPGRRLEIVCTFPDHKRPPDFEILWRAYSIEGVPPCASQCVDREILARQIVVKNLPSNCDEQQLRKQFGSSCDEVEIVEDYQNNRCAIVTFVDVVNCHFAHARQHEIVFDDGTRPEVYLMTETIPNSKLMPRKTKEETDEEREMRHTFELLWNHQQKVANVSNRPERHGSRSGSEYLSRKGLQSLTKRLPKDVKQRIEDRANERNSQEKEREEEVRAAMIAAQEEAIKEIKEQEALAKAQPEAKNGDVDESTTAKSASEEPATATTAPQKRPAASPSGSLSKRPRRKNFRGGGIGAGMPRQGFFGGSGGAFRRDQLPQYYQRGDRGPLFRAGPPQHRPMLQSHAGRFDGGGGSFMNEMRANPWLVPPASGGPSFDRHFDASGSFGTPSALAPRRDLNSSFEHGGATPLFGGPAYGQGPAGYMGRGDMEMHRSAGGSGELYQRRDTMGPDFQPNYRGFYGKR